MHTCMNTYTFLNHHPLPFLFPLPPCWDTHMYVHIYICIYLYVYVYVYVYTYIYVYTYVYLYTYMHKYYPTTHFHTN